MQHGNSANPKRCICSAPLRCHPILTRHEWSARWESNPQNLASQASTFAYFVTRRKKWWSAGDSNPDLNFARVRCSQLHQHPTKPQMALRLNRDFHFSKNDKPSRLERAKLGVPRQNRTERSEVHSLVCRPATLAAPFNNLDSPTRLKGCQELFSTSKGVRPSAQGSKQQRPRGGILR